MRLRNLCAWATLLLAIALCAGEAQAQSATPPAQPAPGQLGGDGPCGVKRLYEANSAYPANANAAFQKVFVYEPMGTASPRSGGTCGDNRRPVVAFVHGMPVFAVSGDPGTYLNAINNLVSNGYIVIFATYPPGAYSVNYGIEAWGIAQGAQMTTRENLADFGIIGHSFGGGMTPYLAQLASAAGWGSNALFLSIHAPTVAYMVGSDPTIALPSNARVEVVSYEHDSVVDSRNGIQLWSGFAIPALQKEYLLIRGCLNGTCLPSDHGSVQTSPEDAIDFFGVYRNVQALAECARFGQNCSVDKTFMGTWSDGRPYLPAYSSRSWTPTDIDDDGPLLQVNSCKNAGNPRSRFCIAGDPN